ncbi:RHS repeat-associated protein [Kitasatospora sp. MAA4]|uniref:RHS repeat-associated core domain-containing protein n=1 Tax=Kitasatospora sp. MAA4 TaxID=3035093 RepID=UPI00247608AB|nr:RHS repeat-associated core domain-containing protein [Kitasatospora sp. MAA4]MDH6137405.1 RHS repeat-associated protein [Kitasatospora sp. MAA4]
MSNQIVKALEDGAKKLGKSLAEDAGKTVKDFYHSAGTKLKSVAKQTAETDAEHEAALKKILQDAKHDEPHEPHLPSEGGGGRGGGKGEPGSGRQQAGNQREAGRPKDSVCEGGEPVDMATGRMFIEQTDAYLPGALALLFNRSFESGYRAGRWMGPRWVCTFDERLEIDAEGVVYLGADRMVQAYPHPAPDEPVQAGAGARWSLSTAAETGDYRLTDPGTGLVREFSVVPGGHEALLTGLRDRSGHRVEFEYDADGTPVSMTHSGGYRLLVTVDGGRITALRLAGAGEDGRDALLTRYGYTDGHLTSVYNSSGKPLRFANDTQGRVVAWTDRNGTQYRYRYDQFDRVVEEGGTDGSLNFRFEYGDPDPDTGLKVHSEINAFGHATVYHVNEHAQVVSQTDPLGNTTLFERDDYDRLLSRTDPLGRTTRFAYDGAGDLVAVTRPDGEQSTAAYDGALSQPTLLTRPGGRIWHQTYDEAGRRTSVTDPTGGVTRYGYDESGHLASVTDAVGQCTSVRCNAAGLPVEVTAPGGATSSYRRDAFGRVIAVTDQLGAVTRVTWTTEGRLASFTAPDGTIETWSYDDEGNLLVHTDQAGQVSTFEYTPFETLAARTAPDGSRLSFSYDADMRLTAVTNALDQSWSYTYDAAGNLVRETDFHGRSVGYQLDAAGQIVARTNPLGQRIEYDYDLLGRVVAKNVAGEVTRYGYDAAGHLLQAISPDAELHRIVDPLGNLLAENVNGRSLSYTRDKLGRRIGYTTPTGHTSLWTYDEAGRRSSLTTSGGRLDFAYDAAGHEAERSIDGQLTLASTWSTEHRLTSQILRTDESVLQRRDYAYRADGALLGVEDQVSGPRAFELDTAGRVTAVQAAGWSERYAYDPAGNLTDADWPASGATSAALGTRTHTGTELTTAGRVRYEYDAAGRTVLRQVTRLSRKPDTWRYTWDAEDRLREVSTPDGTRWRYRYDPFGRRIAKQRLAEDGITVVEQTDFTWDGATLAEQTTHAPYLPGPHTLSWDYRGLHPLAQTETITTPGTADAPQEQIDRRFFAIVTDLVGTPTELVDAAAGTIAWRATRTVWGHTTWPAASTTYTPLRFPGQYFDPETRLHYNLNRYYDPETARYTTPDPLGLAPDPNPDTYVHNPYTWADPLGLAPDPNDELRKELMNLGKQRVDKVAGDLGDDDPIPGAYSVGKDRTTGRIYYGESGAATGHDKTVADAMPTESHHPSGRPPGCCGEPRMFTNAIKDGADPKNIDVVTVNPKGKKFKMCSNCQTWVPGFGGEVLTG